MAIGMQDAGLGRVICQRRLESVAGSAVSKSGVDRKLQIMHLPPRVRWKAANALRAGQQHICAGVMFDWAYIQHMGNPPFHVQ